MLTLNKGGKYSKIKIMRTKYLVGKDVIDKVGFTKAHFRRVLVSSAPDTVEWYLSYYYGETNHTRVKYIASHWNTLIRYKKKELEKLIGHTFVYSTRTAKRVGVYT